jgi:thiamine biosynthesis lipoprotein
LLPRAEALVHAAEQRLSRFIPSSSLCELNRARCVHDPLLAEVVGVALRMRDLTGGLFDPTLGARLQALGYDRSLEQLAGHAIAAAGPYAPCSLEAVVDEGWIHLHGDGELDLGGVAKGFIVDRVAALLAAHGSQRALVDGGGDMRAIGGPWPVGLASGHSVVLYDDAIATSSVRERAWRDERGAELHHVLDPRTGAPAQTSVDMATLRAAEAALADVLATAMLIDAPHICSRLHELGAQAVLRDDQGRWWMSDAWENAA